MAKEILETGFLLFYAKCYRKKKLCGLHQTNVSLLPWVVFFKSLRKIGFEVAYMCGVQAFYTKKKHFNTKHEFHAIRGKFSAELILNKNIPVMGDPGLLCYLLASSVPEKKYAVGIVPHYKDQKNSLVQRFIENNKHVKFIDILSDTNSFIHQVQECEIILSSSLHGLIVADAFAIPNAWIRLSDLVRGEGFKFRDYYSAFGMDGVFPFSFHQETTLLDIQKIREDYQRTNIEKIKNNLLQSFPFQ